MNSQNELKSLKDGRNKLITDKIKLEQNLDSLKVSVLIKY